MGCGPSRPPPQNGFQLHDKRAVFRPPPEPETSPSTEMKRFFSSKSSPKRPEPIPTDYDPQNRAKEVARCASLLREMYTLDLEIWAMTEATRAADGNNNSDREMKMRRADALFVEVRRVVGRWMGMGVGDAGWGPEEWMDVKEICEVVENHGGRRY